MVLVLKKIFRNFIIICAFYQLTTSCVALYMITFVCIVKVMLLKLIQINYCENLPFYNLLTLAEPSLFQTSVADSFCLQQSAD